MSDESDGRDNDLEGRVKGKGGPWVAKPWRAALMRAVASRDPVTKQRRLQQIADRLVSAAVSGDLMAAREIGDRLDGKPNARETGEGPSLSFVVRLPPQAHPEDWARAANMAALTRHTVINTSGPMGAPDRLVTAQHETLAGDNVVELRAVQDDEE